MTHTYAVVFPVYWIGFAIRYIRSHAPPCYYVLDIDRVRYSDSPIAEGGFSFVYTARNVSTGEQYALKKVLCQVGQKMFLVGKGPRNL